MLNIRKLVGTLTAAFYLCSLLAGCRSGSSYSKEDQKQFSSKYSDFNNLPADQKQKIRDALKARMGTAPINKPPMPAQNTNIR
jgi:hypothetical protein